ncbi:MAG: AAC(3) family N-acetyltransferase [Firmicutes bacterium]|nr:AAC(3) family N-acetyltransferase [Bacillota bacterium]
MYTKEDIKKQLSDIGLRSDDTVFVHSSMKAIGEVDGRADTVLDAFIEYLSDGLLIFPTHTWRQINEQNNVFDPGTEPACVGILPNLFMRRPGVVRSLHPTHSVAALGRGAQEYVQGEEGWDTPCSRHGCYGKLYDMSAKVLFVGCSLKTNTILHGVEEWNGIPNRLTDTHQLLKIRTPDGRFIDRPLRRHYHPSGDVSHNYDKIEDALLETGIARLGRIGDAKTYVCDARRMVDLVSSFLKRNPDLFLDQAPIPKHWYSSVQRTLWK